MHKLEPMWWGLFSVGGTIAAFLLPAMILVVGILGPMGIASEATSFVRIDSALDGLISKIGFVVVFSTITMHCMHRIGALVPDLKIPVSKKLASAIGHLGALIMTAAVLVLLLDS